MFDRTTKIETQTITVSEYRRDPGGAARTAEACGRVVVVADSSREPRLVLNSNRVTATALDD